MNNNHIALHLILPPISHIHRQNKVHSHTVKVHTMHYVDARIMPEKQLHHIIEKHAPL